MKWHLAVRIAEEVQTLYEREHKCYNYIHIAYHFKIYLAD